MKSALNKNTRICALNTLKHNTDTHKRSANTIFGSGWFVQLVVLEEKKHCTSRVDEPSTGADLFYTNPSNNKAILCPHLFYMLAVSLFSLFQSLCVCWKFTVVELFILFFYRCFITTHLLRHQAITYANCNIIVLIFAKKTVPTFVSFAHTKSIEIFF